MRSGSTLSKFACTTRPRSIVIACPSAAPRPSSAAPCTWLLGAAGIDDLAADIARDPDLVELDVAGRGDARLHDLGEIAEMAEVEGDAHAGALRQRVRGLHQPDISATSCAERRACGRCRSRAAHRACRRIEQNARLAEQREAEVDRILARLACASSSMKDWKTKASALERGARSGPVGTPELHDRLAVFEVRDELRRELVGIHRRRIGDGLPSWPKVTK